MQKNRILISCILLIFSVLTIAQNSTNSPYTRFGLGDVSDNANSGQRGMGGTSIGFRNAKAINTVNPASYSVVDSLSFMFDVGLSGLYSRFSAPNGNKSTSNGNLEYITLQFPVTKYAGISAGVLPYSFAGYNFSNSDSLPFGNQKIKTTDVYFGTGTISQVYLGAAVKFLNHFSVGANVYYMFGDVNNQRSVIYDVSSYTPNSQSNTVKVNNLRMRYGVQYFNTFNESHSLTIGAFYESKMKMSADAERITQSQVTTSETSSNLFETPQMFGLGDFYSFNKKITVGADFSLQQWQNAKFFGKTDSLTNRMKASFGIEYTPKSNGVRYANRLCYRAGVAISDSYYDVNGQQLPKNLTATIGLGLPMPQSNSMINLSLEYGKIGNRSLMREDYLKLTVSATINEFWFFKHKL
jgi:hypothetical protein